MTVLLSTEAVKSSHLLQTCHLIMTVHLSVDTVQVNLPLQAYCLLRLQGVCNTIQHPVFYVKHLLHLNDASLLKRVLMRELRARSRKGIHIAIHPIDTCIYCMCPHMYCSCISSLPSILLCGKLHVHVFGKLDTICQSDFIACRCVYIYRVDGATSVSTVTTSTRIKASS